MKTASLDSLAWIDADGQIIKLGADYAQHADWVIAHVPGVADMYPGETQNTEVVAEMEARGWVRVNNLNNGFNAELRTEVSAYALGTLQDLVADELAVGYGALLEVQDMNKTFSIDNEIELGRAMREIRKAAGMTVQAGVGAGTQIGWITPDGQTIAEDLASTSEQEKKLLAEGYLKYVYTGDCYYSEFTTAITDKATQAAKKQALIASDEGYKLHVKFEGKIYGEDNVDELDDLIDDLKARKASDEVSGVVKAGLDLVVEAEEKAGPGHLLTEAEVRAEARKAPSFFDPNSTKNEGRKRLRNPQDFDQDTFRRWTKWAGQEAPEGVTFITGTLKGGKKALQTIRFSLKDWDDAAARRYFEKVVNTPGFEKSWSEHDWLEEFPDYKPKAEDYLPEGAEEAQQEALAASITAANARQVLEVLAGKGITKTAGKDGRTVATVAIFRQSGPNADWQLLIERRGREPGEHEWSLPGGHLNEYEDGTTENYLDAAIREIKEETTLSLDRANMHYVMERVRDNKRAKTDVCYATVVSPQNGQAEAHDDAEGLKWVSVGAVPDMVFDHNLFVERSLETLFRHGQLPKLKTNRGFLIVFEGTDGCGKSTQSDLLRNFLDNEGYKVKTTAWSSSDLLGGAIKDGKDARVLTPVLYSMLHAADLIARYDEEILPALAANKVVICDRYVYSSYVRDMLRGVDVRMLDQVYDALRQPDLMFYCYAPLEVALGRVVNGKGLSYYGTGRDLHFDSDPVENCRVYQEQCFKLYDQVVPVHPQVIRLDTDRDMQLISREVLNLVNSLLYAKLDARKEDYLNAFGGHMKIGAKEGMGDKPQPEYKQRRCQNCGQQWWEEALTDQTRCPSDRCREGAPKKAAKHSEKDIQEIIEDAQARKLFKDDATDADKRRLAIEFLDDIENSEETSEAKQAAAGASVSNESPAEGLAPVYKQSALARSVVTSGSPKQVFEPLKTDDNTDLLLSGTAAFHHTVANDVQQPPVFASLEALAVPKGTQAFRGDNA